MEKIDMKREESTDFLDIDDVLDRSFFSDADDLVDLEEDESNYETRPAHYRPISEL
ncbi:hypothetical protein [Marinoscillum furvescens]|uniref:Uncharacterized protein n=1 Tax=Marinoscillum furvescens DSM 4134 TaxID=1122208 RepID=A0A3D9L1H7_MARFU|nr:hypothetical protein [Marinoscillum furvescens]RED97449.1 hypothetical protein C7460_11259 [Marinoscillum furvescens DSM 4134]